MLAIREIPPVARAGVAAAGSYRDGSYFFFRGWGTYTDAMFSGPNSTTAIPSGKWVRSRGVSTAAV
jgi:hypothetical protein